MLTLGIDLGTTKTAAVLYDPAAPGTGRALSVEHHAALPAPAGYAEQDAGKIHDSVLRLLSGFSPEELARVEAIGLTGQMHSLLLWNEKEVSPVITWQDKRASLSGHLDEFRRLSGRPLADGFGAVTLAELARTGELGRWRHAATPSGWLAAQLTGDPASAVTDPSFAASWGIYRPETGDWDRKAAGALGIPENLLPAIVPSGSVAGYTRGVPGIPDGIPVTVPLGDNQASVLGTAQDLERELFLTLGTGAQLSFVIVPEQAANLALPPAAELRPFLDGRLLAVTAPLCGGKAWAWLGNTVNGFLRTLGLDPLPEKALLDRLDALAFEADPKTALEVAPHFLGERHNPDEFGSIRGITLENFTLPNLAGALAAGIVRNLCSSFPSELYRGHTRVVGSGNGVRLCRSIQREIELQFGLPLEIRSVREEAAVGAAKLAARGKQHQDPENR